MSKVHFLQPTERKFAKARGSLNKHVLDPDRGSEGKWQSLVENSPDIIMTVPGDGALTFINHTMPGLTPKQAIGTKVYDYIPTNHHEKIRKSLERVFQTGETVSYEISGIGPHDTASWCVSCVGPVWLDAEVVAAILVATDMTVRNRVEKEIQRKSHNLGERIKELNCLYKASQMMAERDITMDEVLNRLIELLPSAWQFPEITCTRIILYGREFKSENFKKTEWKLSIDITLSGRKIGSMEVYYLEEKPEADEGPFLKEERDLLENLARKTEIFIERRQVDEALHESEAKYRSLIEQSNDAIYLLYDGRFEVTNRRFSELLGITPEEARMPDFNLMDFVAPRSRSLIEERRQMMKRGELPPPFYDFYGLDKEGREFAVEASVKHIPYRNGIAVQGILRDISERKKVEENLRKGEEKLSGIIESIPDFMSIVDEDYNIVWANEVAKDTYGVDITGRKCYEAYHHLDKPCEHCIVREVLADGRIHKHEAETIDKDGNTVYQLSAASVTSRYPDGRTKTVIEVSRDITEHTQLEAQFRQSQKMEGIGRLAGGIAHDFNNLLTVISGHAELASVSLDKKDTLHDDLKEIKNAAHRAADLTRQLLAFSRKQTLQPKVLDLNDIIKELHKMLKRVIGEDIELKTITAPDLWRVNVDPGQIEQVIINLAVNARDAMPGGGKLTIETQNVELDEEYASKHPEVKPGTHAMLAISDTGYGMKEDVKSHIFEPFFTTKEEGKGTGLGLSTVYGIVKQSGGSIWVYSELDEGTTFKVYLPMVTQESDELSREDDTSEAPRGTETILLVEDEEGVRKLACRILKEQGYKVLEAESGVDALLMCQKRKKPVDMVITDVVMPNMSGAVFVKKLRAFWSDFKVLYMSGYTTNAVVHAGVLDKDKPYLQKPFRPVDIAWKVRRVLDGK